MKKIYFIRLRPDLSLGLRRMFYYIKASENYSAKLQRRRRRTISTVVADNLAEAKHNKSDYWSDRYLVKAGIFRYHACMPRRSTTPCRYGFICGCSIFIFLLLFVSLCFADTIYLKSGKEVKGKIIEESDKYIRVEVNGIILRYYLDEIGKVVKEVSPQSKVFTLKPSPLIMPSTAEEKAASQIQATPQDKTTDVPKTPEAQNQPSLETINPPAPPAIDDTADSEDKLAIQRIVKKYLELVSKPLPNESQERAQRLQQLASTLDLKDMPTFKIFKQILAQDAKKNYKTVDEASSVEDKFLESDILRFQKKYLADTKVSINDFKILGIYFPEEQDQATARVNAKDKWLNFKLRKKNSDWLINSIY